MSEIDYSIQLFEGDELNLDPENDLPCGQKIRSENEIGWNQRLPEDSQIRYPLLTMSEVLKNFDLGKTPTF